MYNPHIFYLETEIENVISAPKERMCVSPPRVGTLKI
jgi:hypothetical protein